MNNKETNAVIVVGGLIEQNGKYLLIQEASAKCRGKWNLPAGHLEVGENIFEGALREIREESGCEIDLTGVCQIGNRKRKDLAFVSVIFTAKLIKDNTYVTDPAEIMDSKWFSYEEILSMRDNIRNTDLMIGAIDNYRQGIIAPIDIIKVYYAGAEFKSVMVGG